MLYLLFPLDRAETEQDMSNIVLSAAKLRIPEEFVEKRNLAARIRFIPGQLAGSLIARGKTMHPDEAAENEGEVKQAIRHFLDRADELAEFMHGFRGLREPEELRTRYEEARREVVHYLI